MTELTATAEASPRVPAGNGRLPGAARDDDPSMIAANVALIAELSSNGRSRRAYRAAAEQLIAGEDVEIVAGYLPARMRDCFRAGCELGCLGELLQQELALADRENRRRRTAHSMLFYHGLMFSLVTAFAIAITWFGWGIIRPVEQAVAESMNWSWQPQSDDFDYYYWYLVLQSAFVGICSVVLTVTAIWIVGRNVLSRSLAPAWTYFLFNGRRIRVGMAREELLRFLAVFVAAERPLPEAFAALKKIARLPLSRRVANRCECRAIAGEDPLPDIPRVKSATVGNGFDVRMTASSLSEEAELVALGLDSDIDAGLVVTRLMLILLIAGLLVLGFLTVTVPSLLHIGSFSFGGGIGLF